MVSLVQLIEKLKRTPMDLENLKRILPPKCRVLEYKQLKHANRTKLFTGVEGVLLFMPNRSNKIGHFTTLIPKRHHLEYFSSLGGSPTSDIKRLGLDDSLLKLLGKHYIYNRKALQDNVHSVQDCGCFCIARLYLRELKLREFVGLFQRRIVSQSPDDIVSILCILPFSQI